MIVLQPAGEAHAWPVYAQPDPFLRLSQLVVMRSTYFSRTRRSTATPETAVASPGADAPVTLSQQKTMDGR